MFARPGDLTRPPDGLALREHASNLVYNRMVKRMRLPTFSLSRTFAVLSLVTIGLITGIQVTVQWALLREDLLEWERTVSADAIRTEASARLRPEDFVRWQSPDAQARFEDVFRHALLQLEILRVKVYDSQMRVIWSDEPRLVESRFTENKHLVKALRGETVAHLERAAKAENLYERHFKESVELYVPITFARGSIPGTAAVAGVVEVYKNPSRALANLEYDRWAIVSASLAGAFVLYAVLFGIVHRASRQLEAQREDLERQAVALTAANTELRAIQDQLRASERLAAIGEVSAAVAHGIRNPLASIRAAAQVVRDAPGDSVVAEKYLTGITTEVDRLGRWLRALLDSVRPFELRVAPVDLNAVIDGVLAVLRDGMTSAGIKLELELAADAPTLRADEVQLQQALLAVLENAVDVLPKGGTVGVRSERWESPTGPGVRLTIRDTGEGIPADRLARIFDPFYTTKTRGTGLGLAIARRVIEAHGGSVKVASGPGTGTTFTITLPAAPPSRGASSGELVNRGGENTEAR